jgi:glycerophosphoryl diester phosphodiesterase
MNGFSGVIAHRGGGRLAPENTLDGIRLAATMGYRSVEFDVMLSADGTPVLIHDETLERTTGRDGRVADLHDHELLAVPANRGFADRYPGARIPTLAAAATLCRDLGLLANVEIKPAADFEAVTAATVTDAVAAWFSPDRVLLSSFCAPALAIARARAPQLPRALLFESPPADWPARLAEHAAVALHCDAAKVSAEFLNAARALACPVRCYTVNDPEHAVALFAAGVDAVFTDALDLFQRFQRPACAQ